MKIKLNDNETEAVFAMITFTIPLISGVIQSIMDDKPFVFSEYVDNTHGKVDLKEIAFSLCMLVKEIEPIARSKNYKQFFEEKLSEISKRDMVVMH